MSQPPLAVPPLPPPVVIAPAATPRKGWFRRNLAWVIPVGCLTLLILGAAVVGGALWFGLKLIREESPYYPALEKARANIETREALGEPLEPGWLLQCNIQINNGVGTAQMTIPIQGPRGKGTIHIVAEKAKDDWQFLRLEIQIEGRPERIDLLKESAF